jgi:hypothetical protein
MTEYSKKALEHALTSVTVETEQKIAEILQDSYTAPIRLVKFLHKTSWYIQANPAHPDARDSLAAAVLCAATMLYEWDKTRSGS